MRSMRWVVRALRDWERLREGPRRIAEGHTVPRAVVECHAESPPRRVSANAVAVRSRPVDRYVEVRIDDRIRSIRRRNDHRGAVHGMEDLH